tara:strand:+ start:182 stop:499 length:318 start_codon:yes stop_codon:yes gene_type:complete
MEFLKKLFFTCCFRNKETNRDIDDIKHNEDNINNKIEEAESMMIDMDSSIHKTNLSKRSQLREQQRSQEKIQLTKLDNTRVYSSRRQAMIFKEDAPLPERNKIWK